VSSGRMSTFYLLFWTMGAKEWPGGRSGNVGTVGGGDNQDGAVGGADLRLGMQYLDSEVQCSYACLQMRNSCREQIILRCGRSKSDRIHTQPVCPTPTFLCDVVGVPRRIRSNCSAPLSSALSGPRSPSAWQLHFCSFRLVLPPRTP
jgi:hypothetical protein